jgi:hypothetical protein
MNNNTLLNFKTRHNLATITASSLSAVFLTLSPALAFTFGFCGTFDDGGMVDGKISVNDDGSFDGYAYIKTTSPGAEDRTYKGRNFQGLDTNATHPDLNIPAYKYTFNYAVGDVVFPFPDNKFEVYLPASLFPLVPGERPDLSAFPIVNQYEMRENQLRNDPDRLAVVPEHTSIIGTTIALGLGSLLTKKNLKKLKQDE